MPRFFFASRNGQQSLPDDEGLEYTDQAAAELDAARAAAAMLGDRLRAADPRDVTITVMDQEGQALSHLSASLTIRRGP